MSVSEGECLGLVGANGSGKSSLLRAVLGSVAPTSGEVSWSGVTVTAGKPTLGVVGLIEEPRLFPGLNAVENLRCAHPQRDLTDVRCLAALAEVGLSDVVRVPAGQYSQGMRQRLGLARVLVADPSLVILDEPANGLDPPALRWLRGLVRSLTGRGVAVVISSHMLHEVQEVATSYVMLDAGQVLASGLMQELGAASTLEEVYFAVRPTGQS